VTALPFTVMDTAGMTSSHSRGQKGLLFALPIAGRDRSVAKSFRFRSGCALEPF
jgi:hypothetical protein